VLAPTGAGHILPVQKLRCFEMRKRRAAKEVFSNSFSTILLLLSKPGDAE
jgi:hypothetical protein